MRRPALIVSCAVMLFAFGCESDDSDDEHAHAHEDAGAAGDTHASTKDKTEAKADDKAGATADVKDTKAKSDAPAPYLLKTEKFSIDAGQERYLCFATTLDEDLVIGGYSSKAQPFVHHLVFVRPLAPEPDGFAECDTLFRMTWEPLYITGAGAAKLEFPEDSGHKFTKGTQVLVQMHLLNTSDKKVESTVEIDMHRSTAKSPRSVSAFVLGTSDLSIPPNQESEIEGQCEMKEKVEMIAAFPHMHLLGTSMKVEVGASEDEMKTVFTRDPYDFDDQHIEPIELTLEPGDKTRVTCGYNNTRDETIEFGESTNTEMCFFIGFALDRDRLGTCTQRAQQMKQ
ncbi:MAG TPA: hypothetical protein VFN67_13655 [Polyangiales bacterium]|nr:hypothetical protein [Polyangiales bacterium]